jgi:hypothetical protein
LDGIRRVQAKRYVTDLARKDTSKWISFIYRRRSFAENLVEDLNMQAPKELTPPVIYRFLQVFMSLLAYSICRSNQRHSHNQRI